MFSYSAFPLREPRRNFKATYKCCSIALLPGGYRPELESGGKIILPPSALESLTMMRIEYPMLFKLINTGKSRTTYAGVLEFIADRGKCYMPYWMMQNLDLEDGDKINIESASLPVATYSKFQPQNSDFLDITNPKAVLENTLRNFACLTTGDLIAIHYNRKVYELRVLETKPENAVKVIECDMNVEFEAPVGYEDPKEKCEKEKQPSDIFETNDPFGAGGVRLDGKAQSEDQTRATPTMRTLPRGQPDYNFNFGELLFDRSVIPISDRPQNEENAEEIPQDPFQGEGHDLVDHMDVD